MSRARWNRPNRNPGWPNPRNHPDRELGPHGKTLRDLGRKLTLVLGPPLVVLGAVSYFLLPDKSQDITDTLRDAEMSYANLSDNDAMWRAGDQIRWAENPTGHEGSEPPIRDVADSTVAAIVGLNYILENSQSEAFKEQAQYKLDNLVLNPLTNVYQGEEIELGNHRLVFGSIEGEQRGQKYVTISVERNGEYRRVGTVQLPSDQNITLPGLLERVER